MQPQDNSPQYGGYQQPPQPAQPAQNMFTPANPFATGMNFNKGGGIDPNATATNGFPQVGASLIDAEAVSVSQPVAKKKKKKKKRVNPDYFVKQDSMLGGLGMMQPSGMDADALPDIDLDDDGDDIGVKKRPELVIDDDDDDFL